jgi:hypothetical protein
MTRLDAAWLAALAAVFLAWHIPLMDRTPAGEDEDWYSVPGITILRGGVPRTPYITSDDPRSACYHADVALYTLPPLSFYLQAPIHFVRGEGLGSSRLASALEGLAAVWLVFALGRLWLGDGRAARLGATAFVLSRPFLFPATSARPDMAATCFGLASVWLLARAGPAPGRRSVAASGVAAGMSMLAHPFGVVPATQIGLWLLVAPGRTAARRLGDIALFAAAALAVLSLWLPLIALHPDLFRAQFLGNVFRPAGPASGRSLASVPSAFGFQLRQFWDYAGPLQAILFALGLAWALLRPRSTPGARDLRFHLVAGLVLLLLFQGRHPSLGYFAYPAALASVAVGGLAGDVTNRLARLGSVDSPRREMVATGLVLLAMLAALLPGAGLRTLVAHIRHLGDPGYDARALARAVMADIPPGAATAVDAAYALDFYLAGRPAMVAFIEPDPGIVLYDVRDREFEYLVLGPVGLRLYRSRMPDLVPLKVYGDPRDPFAPYAELFRRGAALPPGRTIRRDDPAGPADRAGRRGLGPTRRPSGCGRKHSPLKHPGRKVRSKPRLNA